MRCIGFVAAITVSFVSIGSAHSQNASEFPNRPLRYIVPFPPGGSTDIVARVVAAALGEQLKQQVVIDNRAGAGGTVGAAIAARASPDGYNIFAYKGAGPAVADLV